MYYKQEKARKFVIRSVGAYTCTCINWPSFATEDEPPQTTLGPNELSPPTTMHSRASIAEQDDQLPPLRPTRSLRSRPLSQRKMLVASYSDAADSAVSMVSGAPLLKNLVCVCVCNLSLLKLDASLSFVLLSVCSPLITTSSKRCCAAAAPASSPRDSILSTVQFHLSC